MEHTEKEIKNWDPVTKWILGISILVLIFAFLSPYVFTSSASSERFDFSETGQIGDTIGGIINPFIALIGVLLTFLAFYMQIKANQIQISQFKKGLLKEKTEKILDEKKDCLNKLNLLKADLATIKTDINLKASNIKEYYEKEKNNPYKTNFLFRTPSKKYARVLEIDRLSIFKGFNIFLSHREKWIKDFSNLYNVLDFLPELFEDIYNKYESHSKDLFNKKMMVRDGLVELMNKLSQIINLYLTETNSPDYLAFPASSLANETIARYYNIVNENFDEEGNPISETDFDRVNNEVLLYFNTQALNLRNQEGYDPRLNPIVEFCANIRKQIFLIKQRSQEFSQSVEIQYNNLMINQEDKKSYYKIIDEIHEVLESELKDITIE
ncbi:hypothetical protein ACIVBQ_002760 [Tenacibaculum discolor]